MWVEECLAARTLRDKGRYGSMLVGGQMKVRKGRNLVYT